MLPSYNWTFRNEGTSSGLTAIQQMKILFLSSKTKPQLKYTWYHLHSALLMKSIQSWFVLNKELVSFCSWCGHTDCTQHLQLYLWPILLLGCTVCLLQYAFLSCKTVPTSILNLLYSVPLSSKETRISPYETDWAVSQTPCLKVWIHIFFTFSSKNDLIAIKEMFSW